jgi:putative ATP-dependent endonuclease of OLD family
MKIMEHILIDRIRVSGFRGLNDMEISLKQTTVLTGMNNAGKTSILKALQLALGNRNFLSLEDLSIIENSRADKIIVDIRIIQIDGENKPAEEFSEEWETIFKADRIKTDLDFAYVPLRTTLKYDSLTSKFNTTQEILNTWEPAEGKHWKDIVGKEKSFSFDEIPFFYIDAQRDIIEDIKIKSSFLGKILSDVKYSKEDVVALEELISDVNTQAIEKSPVLQTIQSALEGLNTALNQTTGGIEITPFAKKIRDLNKGLSIHYSDGGNSFTMDYHGMGTRSWSSLLTLKAFILHVKKLFQENEMPYFPIIAIEEPESHLHPNAQKRLYGQINSMPGQKIISTHSPYIAGSADLSEIRSIRKENNDIKIGQIDITRLNEDDKRKLRQKVINMRGEIFFSKALVLFEGETEEQALPIFAEKHFGCLPSELGIDFIGVGGAGAYLPFLRFAEAFNIPWYIFSDGEPDPVDKMGKAIKKLKDNNALNINAQSNIFIIPDNNDFEKYIASHKGYIKAINDYRKKIELSKCVNDKHKEAVEKSFKTFSKEELLEDAKSNKTEYSLIFAYAIYDSGLALPPKTVELFNQIKTDLGL